MSISKLEQFFLDVHKRRKEQSPDFFRNEKYEEKLYSILSREFMKTLKRIVIETK